MLDRVEVEACAELAVHAREEVARERGGHAGGVVVGGLERARLLHQVEAEEEVVAGRERIGRPAPRNAAVSLRLKLPRLLPRKRSTSGENSRRRGKACS